MSQQVTAENSIFSEQPAKSMGKFERIAFEAARRTESPDGVDTAKWDNPMEKMDIASSFVNKVLSGALNGEVVSASTGVPYEKSYIQNADRKSTRLNSSH